MLLGKALLRPAADTTADKKKTCKTNSNAGYKTREEERDAESKKYRPRRACWHLYGLSLSLFRAAAIHHKSPSNQVNDREHYDPHCIHKVPIKGDHTETFALPRVNPTEQRKGEDRNEKKHSNHDMGRV